MPADTDKPFVLVEARLQFVDALDQMDPADVFNYSSGSSTTHQATPHSLFLGEIRMQRRAQGINLCSGSINKPHVFARRAYVTTAKESLMTPGVPYAT